MNRNRNVIENVVTDVYRPKCFLNTSMRLFLNKEKDFLPKAQGNCHMKEI